MATSLVQRFWGDLLPPWHIRVYRQLRRFVLADAGMPSFRVAKAGRRFPQLVARLSELSGCVADLGLAGGPYSRSFQGQRDQGEQQRPLPS